MALISENKKSLPVTALPTSPTKNKKLRIEPTIQSKVEQFSTIVKTEPDEDIFEKHSDDSEEEFEETHAIKRKNTPLVYRLGDIFQTARLSLDHKPQRKDFIKAVPFTRETDPNVLARRSKQIEYGRNTVEYAEYTSSIPREKREAHHPRTPNMHRKYSRRAWDGLIRQWRCKLHLWEKSADELNHNIQIQSHNDSFSSSTGGTSTSTGSSVAGDDIKPDPDTFGFDSDEHTLQLTPSSSVHQPLTSTPVPIIKQEKSWYEETLEFEEEFLTLHAEEDDLFSVKGEGSV